jgi:hypothetical protein
VIDSQMTQILQISTDEIQIAKPPFKGGFAIKINMMIIFINTIMRQTSSKNIKSFSLIGKWKNVTKSNDKSSIELFFYDNEKMAIRITPGNEFQYHYSIESKVDYSILRFANEATGEIGLLVILFKIEDRNTLKVQVIDKNDIPEWDYNASEINNGFLRRKKE